jgi:hypothetical protein
VTRLAAGDDHMRAVVEAREAPDRRIALRFGPMNQVGRQVVPWLMAESALAGTVGRRQLRAEQAQVPCVARLGRIPRQPFEPGLRPAIGVPFGPTGDGIQAVIKLPAGRAGPSAGWGIAFRKRKRAGRWQLLRLVCSLRG